LKVGRFAVIDLRERDVIVKILLLFRMNGKKLVVVTVVKYFVVIGF